jgi:hypothetical protein
MIAKRNHRLFPLAPFGEQGQCRIVSRPGVRTFNRMSAGGVLLAFGPALVVVSHSKNLLLSDYGRKVTSKKLALHLTVV